MVAKIDQEFTKLNQPGTGGLVIGPLVEGRPLGI